MNGFESAPCNVCGEECVVRRGTTPACRMTPNCSGRHEPPIPEQLRRTDRTPLHRVDDPPTSRAAAKTQTPGKLSETRLRVLEALRRIGPATDHEIAAYAELVLSSCSKRRGDLTKLGLVEESGRGVSPNGAPATTWRITIDGLTALDQIHRTRGGRGAA